MAGYRGVGGEWMGTECSGCPGILASKCYDLQGWGDRLESRVGCAFLGACAGIEM